MKYLFAILMAFLLSACTKVEHVEFTGTTPGVESGVLVIKDASGSTISGGNITGGKFSFTKTIQNKGYYSVSISDGKATNNFELYLEDGKYDITAKLINDTDYPKIVTTSKTQNELTAYYTLGEKLGHDAHQKSVALMNQVTSPAAASMSKEALTALSDKLKTAQDKEVGLVAQTLDAFANKYPQSPVGPHIMATVAQYQNDPVVYYKIYQKFGADAKSTDEGKEVGGKLSFLVKVMPGAEAPALTGTTPDGKTVDFKAMHKKLILLEFWRSDSRLARVNHQEMMLNPLPGVANNKLGIVSFSFDTKDDWWRTAVKDDKMNWTQVADLKGDNSPNVDNWGVEDIPSYSLIDGNGRIVDRNIPYTNLVFSISDYLSKHP